MDLDMLRRILAYASVVLVPLADSIVSGTLGIPSHTIAYKVAAGLVALFAALRIHPNGVNGPAASSRQPETGDAKNDAG